MLGLLNAKESAAIEIESQQLFAAGFTTLKVKVGFDIADDAAMVKRIQKIVNGRAQLRLDANQGYSLDDACAFVRSLEPDGLELFDQPFAAGRASRVQNVLDHRTATRHVHDLRQLGLHPSTFAGGQDDCDRVRH